MARKKKTGKKNALARKLQGNLPTQERILKGDISIRGNIGLVDEPMRIDKLLYNGVIDEMQHLYGMQIITYWLIANRPFIRTASYEQRIGKSPQGAEHIHISRMGAEDKFYKTMAFMSERERALIRKICLEEIGAIEAGRSIGLPVNSITAYVRSAFDALGHALSRMRDFRRERERAEETDA